MDEQTAPPQKQNPASVQHRKEQAVTSSNDQTQNKPEEKVVAGYNVGDIVEAPIKPPEPIQTDSARETSNKKVRSLVALGVLLAAFGLFFIVFVNPYAGIPFLLLAIAAICISVFAPVH